MIHHCNMCDGPIGDARVFPIVSHIQDKHGHIFETFKREWLYMSHLPRVCVCGEVFRMWSELETHLADHVHDLAGHLLTDALVELVLSGKVYKHG